MSGFGVHSEVGKLRKVMVHRPDLSLQRLTPSTHDDLLFDDVLWVERAQYEHDQFVARMRERGVEVFLLSDLLTEALGLYTKTAGKDALKEYDGVFFIYAGGRVETTRGGLYWPRISTLRTHCSSSRMLPGQR